MHYNFTYSVFLLLANTKACFDQQQLHVTNNVTLGSFSLLLHQCICGSVYYWLSVTKWKQDVLVKHTVTVSPRQSWLLWLLHLVQWHWPLSGCIMHKRQHVDLYQVRETPKDVHFRGNIVFCYFSNQLWPWPHSRELKIWQNVELTTGYMRTKFEETLPHGLHFGGNVKIFDLLSERPKQYARAQKVLKLHDEITTHLNSKPLSNRI